MPIVAQLHGASGVVTGNVSRGIIRFSSGTGLISSCQEEGGSPENSTLVSTNDIPPDHSTNENSGTQIQAEAIDENILRRSQTEGHVRSAEKSSEFNLVSCKVHSLQRTNKFYRSISSSTRRPVMPEARPKSARHAVRFLENPESSFLKPGDILLSKSGANFLDFDPGDDSIQPSPVFEVSELNDSVFDIKSPRSTVGRKTKHPAKQKRRSKTSVHNAQYLPGHALSNPLDRDGQDNIKMTSEKFATRSQSFSQLSNPHISNENLYLSSESELLLTSEEEARLNSKRKNIKKAPNIISKFCRRFFGFARRRK